MKLPMAFFFFFFGGGGGGHLFLGFIFGVGIYCLFFLGGDVLLVFLGGVGFIAFFCGDLLLVFFGGDLLLVLLGVRMYFLDLCVCVCFFWGGIRFSLFAGFLIYFLLRGGSVEPQEDLETKPTAVYPPPWHLTEGGSVFRTLIFRVPGLFSSF